MLSHEVWQKFTDVSEVLATSIISKTPVLQRRVSYADRDPSGDTALMMEAASTSELSVNLYPTTRRNIPEDSHIQRDSYLGEIHTVQPHNERFIQRISEIRRSPFYDMDCNQDNLSELDF
jgi:hypothetical protein